MHLTWKFIGIVGALGLIAGIIASLLGLGAGIIVVPVLSYMWDRACATPQKLAQGTALALMLPMAIAGCLRYHFGGEPGNWRLALLIATYALVASAVVAGLPLLLARAIGYEQGIFHVNWETAAVMSVTAVIGVVWLGAPLANALPTLTLRYVFATVLLIIGVMMMGWHTAVYHLFMGGPTR